MWPYQWHAQHGIVRETLRETTRKHWQERSIVDTLIVTRETSGIVICQIARNKGLWPWIWKLHGHRHWTRLVPDCYMLFTVDSQTLWKQCPRSRTSAWPVKLWNTVTDSSILCTVLKENVGGRDSVLYFHCTLHSVIPTLVGMPLLDMSIMTMFVCGFLSLNSDPATALHLKRIEPSLLPWKPDSNVRYQWYLVGVEMETSVLTHES